MRFDDSLEHYVSNVIRPPSQLVHVSREERVQPREEVNRMTLIDFIEDFVEVSHHGFEMLVFVVKASGAEVLNEHVCKGTLEEGFDLDAFVAAIDSGLDGSQQDGRFYQTNAGHEAVIRRDDSRRAVLAGNTPSFLLKAGPIAQG